MASLAQTTALDASWMPSSRLIGGLLISSGCPFSPFSGLCMRFMKFIFLLHNVVTEPKFKRVSGSSSHITLCILERFLSLFSPVGPRGRPTSLWGAAPLVLARLTTGMAGAHPCPRGGYVACPG